MLNAYISMDIQRIPNIDIHFSCLCVHPVECDRRFTFNKNAISLNHHYEVWHVWEPHYYVIIWIEKLMFDYLYFKHSRYRMHVFLNVLNSHSIGCYFTDCFTLGVPQNVIHTTMYQYHYNLLFFWFVSTASCFNQEIGLKVFTRKTRNVPSKIPRKMKKVKKVKKRGKNIKIIHRQ